METLEVGEGGEDIQVVDDVTEVGGNDDGRSGAAKGADSLVGRLEGILDLGPQVENEDGLVDLDALGAGGLEGLEELDVDGDELVEKGDGVNRGTTVSLAEGKEGDGSEKDGPGVEASLLGLEEFPNGLGVLGEGEGLVILESGLHVVVVRVEPLDHLESGDVNSTLLVATAHGEVLISSIELLRCVTLGDSLSSKKGELLAGKCYVRPRVGRPKLKLTLKSWMWSRTWS